jgi:hypothetical protein
MVGDRHASVRPVLGKLLAEPRQVAVLGGGRWAPAQAIAADEAERLGAELVGVVDLVLQLGQLHPIRRQADRPE